MFCCEETWRKKKLNVLLIVPLNFQCEERAQEAGFFFHKLKQRIQNSNFVVVVSFVFVVSGFLWVK